MIQEAAKVAKARIMKLQKIGLTASMGFNLAMASETFPQSTAKRGMAAPLPAAAMEPQSMSRQSLQSANLQSSKQLESSMGFFSSQFIIYFIHMRPHCFAGGPTKIPDSIHLHLKSQLQHASIPIYEQLHSKDLLALNKEFSSALAEFYRIPSDFLVVHTAGGAQLHFGAIPLNFKGEGQFVNYSETGYFSKKASQQAHKCAKVHVFSRLKQDEAGRLMVSQYDINSKSKLLHYVDNQSVEGIQLTPELIPQLPGAVVTNDSSSNFLTKPVDWSKLDMLYAHAQKNCGITGSTVCILRRQAVDPKLKGVLPKSLDYNQYLSGEGQPGVRLGLQLYHSWLMLKWMREQGDIEYWHRRHVKNSALIYDVIDKSKIFIPKVTPAQRSRITVTFDLPQALLHPFLDQAESAGLCGLKGHRAMGGCRASLFNGVSERGVEELADFMKEFQAKQRE